LIVSEHLFWIAGLLIWVSLFYFIVWLLRDVDKVLNKNRKHIKRIWTVNIQEAPVGLVEKQVKTWSNIKEVTVDTIKKQVKTWSNIKEVTVDTIKKTWVNKIKK
jgi:hypothetical protein